MEHIDHILIVDDDREIRELVSSYLKKNGLRTTVAADGRQMRSSSTPTRSHAVRATESRVGPTDRAQQRAAASPPRSQQRGRVDARGAVCTVCQRRDSPRADVTAHIEHAGAGPEIACKPRAVRRLVVEPAGFLASAQRRAETQPCFDDLDFFWDLAERHFSGRFELLEIARAGVVLPEEPLGRNDRAHGLFDVLLIIWLVWNTGYVNSPYAALYIVVISVASLFLGPRGALITSIGSAAASVAVHFTGVKHGVRLVLDGSPSTWTNPHSGEAAGELLDRMAVVGFGEDNALAVLRLQHEIIRNQERADSISGSLR